MTVWADYSMLPLQRQLEVPCETHLHADKTEGSQGSERQPSPLPALLQGSPALGLGDQVKGNPQSSSACLAWQLSFLPMS